MVGPDRVEISRHTDKVDASATLPNERVALS